MTNDNNTFASREVPLVRKIIVMAAIVVAVLALTAAPALAEGYNGYTWDGAGNFTDGQGDYTRASGSFSGPHGGYNSTTNKCQDCHSTHYASGSYMLLRANSREQACDFCHVGGGGSDINIQMDNAYDANSVSITSTETRGMGTGHTLGYQGNAPVDINPAFTSADGFACFDCHTPHGNSARVLSTFANPGRAFEPTTSVVYPFAAAGADGLATYTAAGGTDPATNGGLYDLASVGDAFGGALWGTTETEGNIVLNKSGDGSGAMKKPIWPTGRFLLLKNPDVEMVAGVEVTDTVVSDDADNGVNKFAINWDDPLGPADTGYGGEQDRDYNKTMPWNPSPSAAAEFGYDNYGLSSTSEFCTDCHDGAAGASTQRANVWYPDGSTNDHNGAYALVYSHDAQPRH